MVLAGVDFWYNNYGLWPWQAKPRPKMNIHILLITAFQKMSDLTPPPLSSPHTPLLINAAPFYFQTSQTYFTANTAAALDKMEAIFDDEGRLATWVCILITDSKFIGRDISHQRRVIQG